MNQIESIYLDSLRNDDHSQFMTDTKKCIESKGPAELGIADDFTEFSNRLDLENMVLMVENSSLKSKEVAKLKKLRGKIWTAINYKIKSHLNSPFDDEVASAEVIKHIWDQYGDVRSLSYNEESSAITKLTDQLLADGMAAHIEKTEIKRWVLEYKKQNEQFQLVFNERNTEWANQPDTDTQTARLQVDAIYNDIIGKINAMFTLKLEKEIAISFAKDMNEKIDYYKTTVSARASRNNKAGKSKSTDTPTT